MRWHNMRLWVAYGVLAAALAGAVFFHGGVDAHLWEWSALGVCLAALLAPWDRASSSRGRSLSNKQSRPDWTLWLAGALAAWIVLALAPLPPMLVHLFAPGRFEAARVARLATGQGLGRWLPLSIAPAATFERLLDVLPAMAAFLLARQMGSWWPGRPWIAVAPIVAIALFESVLGMLQFSNARTQGAVGALPSGTYIYHNHFAGLLEIAFPPAAMWAVGSWRKLLRSRRQTAELAAPAVELTIAAMCLFMGILVSLSPWDCFRCSRRARCWACCCAADSRRGFAESCRGFAESCRGSRPLAGRNGNIAAIHRLRPLAAADYFPNSSPRSQSF